jgi:hypothetical protein
MLVVVVAVFVLTPTAVRGFQPSLVMEKERQKRRKVKLQDIFLFLCRLVFKVFAVLISMEIDWIIIVHEVNQEIREGKRTAKIV